MLPAGGRPRDHRDTGRDSSMWQSVADTAGSSVTGTNTWVHQQDVEAVVNALWAGGAESMEVMGQRLLPTSAVICSGNVLPLQGKKYSPPFTISAIGLARTDEACARHRAGRADLQTVCGRVRPGV